MIWAKIMLPESNGRRDGLVGNVPALEANSSLAPWLSNVPDAELSFPVIPRNSDRQRTVRRQAPPSPASGSGTRGPVNPWSGRGARQEGEGRGTRSPGPLPTRRFSGDARARSFTQESWEWAGSCALPGFAPARPWAGAPRSALRCQRRPGRGAGLVRPGDRHRLPVGPPRPAPDHVPATATRPPAPLRKWPVLAAFAPPAGPGTRHA